jgi:hypothetical protein
VEINNSDIELKSVNKLFEYEKISRDIDSISDIEIIRKFAKLYIKLYFKQQEILLNL